MDNKKDKDEELEDDRDFDDSMDLEYEKEREEERLAEIAFDCKCGAWQFSKSHRVVHVADCVCGAEY